MEAINPRRLQPSALTRLLNSVGQGEVLSWFSTTRTDVETGESFPELDPKHFSFNAPAGACPA